MQLSANTPKYYSWGLNAVLGVAFVLELLIPGWTPLLYSIVLILAAAASVAALTRQLPLQNVLLAAAITAILGSAAHGLSAACFIPFGPIIFGPSIGKSTLGTIPLTIPFMWIVAVFNARGVVRLILRPWRKTKRYGWWLIGLTAFLTMAFDVALEPFAIHAKHLWLWGPTKIPFTWEGASPISFPGWFFVTLLILAFTTPSLIRKQPSSSKTPDLHPLIVWLGALLLFATGCAESNLWVPVIVDAAVATVTLVFAVRGVRW
jgi:uncharacterized membrane protein